jgi:hypothetical protein
MEQYLSINEVVRRLREIGIKVSVETVRGWCHQHPGFGVRVTPTSRWHIPESQIRALYTGAVASDGHTARVP